MKSRQGRDFPRLCRAKASGSLQVVQVEAEPNSTRFDAASSESTLVDNRQGQIEEYGPKIGENYRVERLIGVGGSGAVYQVEHVFLGKRFALKRLHSTDPRHVQRLINEARAVATLQHPNVVNVSDFGHTSDGSPFMVMELLQGQPLGDLIRVAAPLPASRALVIILQILNALQAAHERGIVHRDIKPGNCFCIATQGEDFIKILDFGIAALGSCQVPNTRPVADAGIIGTLKYMSPEQATGESLDHRSDLYSAAVVLYELLTGKPPFHGCTGEQLLLAQAYDSPPPLFVANPAVDASPTLQSVIMRALSKSPSDRFATAAEFAQALRACQSSDKREQAATATSVIKDEYSDVLEALASRVKRYWIDGALRQDLSQHPVADLEYTIDYSMVKNPWEGTLTAPQRPVQVHRTPVFQTFLELGRSMLVLGEPGSGKTFTLLSLAEAILSRIEHNPACGLGVPVVFALSTWSGSFREFSGWLVDELRSKYHVPVALGRALVERRRILPLLDGLDEVAKRHRKSCTHAINSYVEIYGTAGCVVCCQSEAYEGLQRLCLTAAVCIRPLDSEQLHRYLAQATDTEEECNQLIRASAALGELARNPWMLRMLLAAKTTGELGSGGDPLHDVTVRQQFVRAYVEHALSRTGRRALRWTRQEFHRSLVWLAASMRNHQQTVFKWEEIQPTWLRHFTGYLCLSQAISALLFGASFILGFGLTPFKNAGLQSDLHFGVYFGLCAFVVAWIYYCGWAMLRFNRSVQENSDEHRPPTKLKRVAAVLFATLMTSLGLCALLVPRYGVGVLPMAIEAALFGALVFGEPMLRRGRTRDVQTAELIQWSWSGARVWGWLIVTCAVGIGSAVAWFEDSQAGLSVAAATLIGGLLLSFARRRRITPDIAPNYGIHSTFFQALRIATLVGFLMAFIVSVQYGWSYALCVGLTFAILAFLRFGGDDVIRHYSLRVMLGLQTRLPKDLPDVFDAAADRQLLRRIGGGYMFIHGGLMDVLVDDASA